MDEFDFIATHLAPLAGLGGLGLIDDAAILSPSPDKDLILTKDTMVEGIHFPKGHYGGDTAEKLLRVNLSDLAAKGARPIGYMLSIAWPRGIDTAFYVGFTTGLREVQDAYGFKLLGGDTVSTDGPMVVTATLIGEVPQGEMVTRNGAKVGDDIWVTGTIGDAYLGLQSVLGRRLKPTPSQDGLLYFEEAYYRPEPRLLFRKALRQYAGACADISDGLIADLGHIASASGICAVIEIEALPLSPAAKAWLLGQNSLEDAFKTLMTAGDDYELGFTASPEFGGDVEVAAKTLGLRVSRIGRVENGVGLRASLGGKSVKFDKTGHTHF